jgi:hypothetical protein
VLRRVAGTVMAGLALQALAGATCACPVIDATVAVAQVAAATAGKPEGEQLAAYQREVIDRWPGLYRQDVLGLTPGPVMDRQILRSLEAARRDGERTALKSQLRTQTAATAREFRVFPDFRSRTSKARRCITRSRRRCVSSRPAIAARLLPAEGGGLHNPAINLPGLKIPTGSKRSLSRRCRAARTTGSG